MKYGYFDDTRCEYVITRPDPPLPWINYLGAEDMYGLVSNTGGGYAFHRDARYRRLTRYRYNNVPLDSNGRYFYIRQADGSFWSPGWQPVRRELHTYRCRHGLGYTIIESSLNDIHAEMTFLIPPGDNAEIHRLRLVNRGTSPRRITLFSFVEFCLWDADDDDRNFQRNLSTGEVEVHGATLYHTTEYRERRNHYCYYHLNREVDGFDTDREAFLGPYGSLQAPRTVVEGRATNSVASGWAPVASHVVNLDLQPADAETFIFVLGYVENPAERKFDSRGGVQKQPARQQYRRYETDAGIEAALENLRLYWQEVLSPYRIECADQRLARMVNVWNPYQCMVTFNLSRSASYFESGIGRGIGFRDGNQDLLGFVHQVPERARRRILAIAATQRPDGSAFHQFQPLTGRGNSAIGGDFNDDPLWLILSVGAYIRETGRTDILVEDVPFENDPALAAPLLDHLFRSWRHTLDNLGPHGLPLIGRADWNDCLNLNCFSRNPDESFQTTANRDGTTAESLMIAGLFVFACREFADMLDFIGRSSQGAKVRQTAGTMTAAVNEHGRDPNWFLRAYDFSGNRVGSRQNVEGKIFIESQGWCVMAGIGHRDGFARKALDSVAEHLATPHGIGLVDPPYNQYHLELGEISSYPPGYKENGGIFCHANPWIVIAETMVGNVERAFDYYRRITPAYREEQSDVHRLEPYVYAQMIAGKAAPRHGEAKNSWLTGTAAWNYVAVTQYILGIRPGYRGLIVDPCCPDTLCPVTVKRRFRGTTYRIKIRRAEKGETTGLYVNGRRARSNTILPQGDEIRVDAIQ